MKDYIPPKEKIAQFDNEPVSCLFVNPSLMAKLIEERRRLDLAKRKISCLKMK